jgi:hypothetical protein
MIHYISIWVHNGNYFTIWITINDSGVLLSNVSKTYYCECYIYDNLIFLNLFLIQVVNWVGQFLSIQGSFYQHKKYGRDYKYYRYSKKHLNKQIAYIQNIQINFRCISNEKMKKCIMQQIYRITHPSNSINQFTGKEEIK